MVPHSMLMQSTPDINYYQQLAYYAVLITCALIGIIAILIGLVLRGQRRSREAVATTNETANSTLKEVKNTHEVNLRDDLDEKFEGLAEILRTHGKEIGGIRVDIRQIHSDQSTDRATAVEAVRVAQSAVDLVSAHTKQGETQ
jgi:hypothetical protein